MVPKYGTYEKFNFRYHGVCLIDVHIALIPPFWRNFYYPKLIRTTTPLHSAGHDCVGLRTCIQSLCSYASRETAFSTDLRSKKTGAPRGNCDFNSFSETKKSGASSKGSESVIQKKKLIQKDKLLRNHSAEPFLNKDSCCVSNSCDLKKYSYHWECNRDSF